MRALFAFALAGMLLAAYLNAEDTPPIPPNSGTLLLKAIYTNGSAVSSSPIIILARSGSDYTVYRLITDASGGILIFAGDGKYEIDAILDDYRTPGIDYAATASLDPSKNGSALLLFYPAGSASGKVSQNGSAVSGAKVLVSCQSSSFDYARVNGAAEVKTDEAGGFSFKALPTGACIFSASMGPLAGSREVNVEASKNSQVEIVLAPMAAQSEKTQAASQEGGILVPVAVLLLMVAGVIVYYTRIGREKPHHKAVEETGPQETAKPAQKKSAKAKAAEKPVEEKESSAYDISSPKVKAVLATLSEREAEIVKYIFKCNGRAKRSSIQHRLLIPKTSLLRNLRSLERKKILRLTPFGRNLVAEVEDWISK